MTSFATKTELMPHQKDAVAKLSPTRISGLFADMGTGKTRIVTELIHRRQNRISKVVYFCPVSLKETVRQEIAKHTTLDDVYVFDDKTSTRNLPKASWYIVGIESMSSSARVICAVNELVDTDTYAIVDESSYIKGHRALRTERITRICEHTRYRTIMTGTPLSQGVVDLYAQMRFLSSKILGYNSFYSFAANHLEYSDRFPGMIVRAHNTKYIAAKINPYVYQITKDECLNLPAKLYETRYCSLTDSQWYHYERVKDEILNEIDLDDWDSVAIFRLFTALQEIVSGFLNWKGRYYEFDCERPQLLIDTIHDIAPAEKVIVFCKFQYDMNTICSKLAKEFGEDSVSKFDGRDNEKRRQKAVDKFRDESRFLVATQATGGHGFNFQELAHYVIFYNNGFKYSEREQAEDRVYRIGQTKRPVYIDLYCTSSIDERIHRAIARKASVVASFRRDMEKAKSKRSRKQLIKSL
jgi:SNF2 family DNA or RNA helicase